MSMAIDWGVLLFMVLVAGAAGGFLLCFRHMMHEGTDDHDKSRDRKDTRAHG